jgi:uncharacterized protein YjiK
MIALGLACMACDGSATVAKTDAAPNVVRWQLPKQLKEISGLAFSGDERLFAHNDERAVIHQIDWQHGNIVKTFSFGDPALRDDFEAIAIAGADFYLITSTGILYRFNEGADGAHVAYTRIDTGLGTRCEVEGLAYDARRNVLLVACKTPRSADLEGKVAVFAWSLERQALDPTASFAVRIAAILDRLSLKHFSPSSIEVARDGTHLWLLSARQGALVEVGLDGQLVTAMRLPGKLHPQPEGLAIAADGRFIISDEAVQGNAMLAIYPPR